MLEKIKFWAPTIFALTVGLAAVSRFVWFCNRLADELHKESEYLAETLVKATELINKTSDAETLNFALDMLKSNESVPIMYCQNPFDQKGPYRYVYRNIGEDANGKLSKAKQDKKWKWMRENAHSVKVYYDDNKKSYQTVYYDDSKLQTYVHGIRALPFVAALLFLMFAYIVVSRRQRRERDSLWKGLAMETAHQLGTPIMGVEAWHDILQTGYGDTQTAATEVEKDIDRLKKVSDRFSHLGSKPNMVKTNLNDDIRYVVGYIDHRTSKKISVTMEEPDGEVVATHDPTLLSWSVENLCKNAADAIGVGEGKITVTLRRRKKGGAMIDIADNGKGMSAKTRHHLFDAGYTTKERGWGMGLALVKRIVNKYHNGKVYVLSSELGKGTTFRIELKE